MEKYDHRIPDRVVGMERQDGWHAHTVHPTPADEFGIPSYEGVGHALRKASFDFLVKKKPLIEELKFIQPWNDKRREVCTMGERGPILNLEIL